MKTLVKTLVIILLLFSPSLIHSQVTGLLVNGSPASFSVTSGDLLTWSYNLPVGETAVGDLWLDLNLNHAIDSGIDRRVLNFTQTDGDTLGNNGPPDMDGVANGSVSLTMPLGLAPQDYLFSITNNGSGQSVWGSVAHLAPPAYTISGTVTGPLGFDLEYNVVEASASGMNDIVFWHGLTDSLGHYVIEMNSDTAGNPWEVGMFNLPPPYTVTPQDTLITIDGNKTGVNFTVLGAAAQVFGQLLDDTGDSLAFVEVFIARNDNMGGNVSHWMSTDQNGRFQFGIPLPELNGNTWRLGMPTTDQPVGTHMLAASQLPALGSGDNITRDIVAYVVNSSISGFVQIDGAPPGFPVFIMASNADSGESYAWSDSITGSFSIPVSDRIANYSIWAREIMGAYQFPNVVAHPGDAGVIYNLQTTGVGDGGGTLPAGYSLGQNYPNPFNPSTTIPYAIASGGQVVLKIYDVLGREVAVLVDENQGPGYKTVSFDAASLPSGVYQYRISAGAFTAARTLLVIR